MANHLIKENKESDLEFILRMEPRLSPLLEQAKTIEPEERWQEYTRLKRIANVLVGFSTSNPRLRESWYYQVFIQALEAALPKEEEGAS